MELFLKACGAVLLTVILVLSFNTQSRDLSLVLLIGVCCMTALVALNYLEPVIDFVRQLEQLGNIDSSLVRILQKAVGIGLISEIAAMICSDAGSNSLGKGIQFLGSAVILWLSLPMFTMLMDLLRQIVGDL